MKESIAIGNDHAGLDYKDAIIELLEGRGYYVLNKGTDLSDSVDYPDFAHPVAMDVSKGFAKKGIVMCGSGNGVAITVNKHKDIRAGLCWNKEVATLARKHNDANILALPVRFVSEAEALEIVTAFLDTEFEGGRHANRVEKICL